MGDGIFGIGCFDGCGVRRLLRWGWGGCGGDDFGFW
jgi:hypothetical protein